MLRLVLIYGWKWGVLARYLRKMGASGIAIFDWPENFSARY